ncbi:MAG: hypothetical protein ABW168_26470 [Sedimenticola sp.]
MPSVGWSALVEDLKMVDPISSDKIAASITDRNRTADNGIAELKHGEREATSEQAPERVNQEDSAGISRAGEVLSNPRPNSSGVTVENADQAVALSAKISKQVEEAVDHAIEVYGNVSAEQITGLLSQAPT